ncbi:hypothetical protein I7X12_04450 [Halosimplex litoreum]|uniref:Uncharacterized protein n=1 Tax=Halosimplex litoreum TaxID=1198301 RepID=A0A7T3G089_9EURY|nr:hypothetical protein [Halosimplex litoreum]QPV63887.1 hypothetical protein I7X12_04450 [Halosimplex litoreum]
MATKANTDDTNGIDDSRLSTDAVEQLYPSRFMDNQELVGEWFLIDGTNGTLAECIDIDDGIVTFADEFGQKYLLRRDMVGISASMVRGRFDPRTPTGE